jgi:hypothetical protein
VILAFLSFLLCYPVPAFRFIKDLHQSSQIDRSPLAELEAGKQIYMLPGDRRYAFENLHPLLVASGLLPFQHTGRDRRVVIDHRIGDEPRALVQDLLFGFGANAQLSLKVGTASRASFSAVNGANCGGATAKGRKINSARSGSSSI